MLLNLNDCKHFKPKRMAIGREANANSLSPLRPSVRKFLCALLYSLTRNSGEAELSTDPLAS